MGKLLKIIIIKELESSIYMNLWEVFFFFFFWSHCNEPKGGWVWFLIVAMYRRHLFDQLLLVLSWTIVNHCAVISVAESFLPLLLAGPTPSFLNFFSGGVGDDFVFAWVDVLIVVRKNAFQTHFTHELFSYTVCLIVNKNVISWYRYLISFLSK